MDYAIWDGVNMFVIRDLIDSGLIALFEDLDAIRKGTLPALQGETDCDGMKVGVYLVLDQEERLKKEKEKISNGLKIKK